jgi:hypothetical protein
MSWEVMSNKAAQILIYSAFAKQLMFYFVITALGVVSKIYRDSIFQGVRVDRTACGIAARLAAHSSTFVELQDHAHGISEEKLFERFKVIFEHNSEIDEAELRRLVRFVFSGMAKDHNDGIDIQDFSHACTHGEILHFRTLVELFDADRKKGWLEKQFADPAIRNLHSSDRLCKEDVSAAANFVDRRPRPTLEIM